MLPPTPAVSVIVAAFDLARWPLLERAVASALAQKCPFPVQVVLAIDNNRELDDRARRELAGVDVVLHEGPRGASAARNAGAAAATGDVLVFLDDDAEAHAGWLAALVAPLRDPEVVGVGGGVVPAWPRSTPAWFPPAFGWVVGASYEGLPVSEAPVRNAWSENMAVRAADFRAVGGFRVGFGKVGHVSRPEDTEFCLRLRREVGGALGWWHVPGARVSHSVPADRATFRFFLRRCLAEGRGKAAMAELAGREDSTSAERQYATRVLPRAVLRGVSETVRGDAWGAARAGAVVAGLGAAALGWVQERAAHRALIDAAPAPVAAA